MAINNQKGLAALKALASGGSAGLDAYKQAQASEAASRTTALQGALGGQDVAAAAQKAQAQYAPKVATGDLGIGNLDVAANTYLSNAANKLAAQNYEDQQRLSLQASQLQQKESAISQAEREAQLLGAAEIMGQKQQADVQQAFGVGTSLNDMAARKAQLRQQLTEYDKNMGQSMALAALSGDPTATQRIQQGREDILRQMGETDQQFAAASEGYAGLLGTDNKGFLEAYTKADQGDAEAIKALNSYLDPQAAEAQQSELNRIAVGGQERLRALAPAFGIDELTAAGRFREGEGDDLARIGQRGKEEAFVAGDTKAQRMDRLSEKLNIEDADVFGKALDRTGVSDDEAIDLLSGETGSIVEQAFIGALNAPIGSDTYGEKGLVANLQSLSQELYPDDPKKQAKFVQVADAYYGPKVRAVTGAGRVEEE